MRNRGVYAGDEVGRWIGALAEQDKGRGRQGGWWEGERETEGGRRQGVVMVVVVAWVSAPPRQATLTASSSTTPPPPPLTPPRSIHRRHSSDAALKTLIEAPLPSTPHRHTPPPLPPPSHAPQASFTQRPANAHYPSSPRTAQQTAAGGGGPGSGVACLAKNKHAVSRQLRTDGNKQ